MKPKPRPKSKPKSKVSAHATHVRTYKAKLVKQGRCRQCGRPRGKSSSKVRCKTCLAHHARQMKQYRHDRVSQKVVQARPQNELGRLTRSVEPALGEL